MKTDWRHWAFMEGFQVTHRGKPYLDRLRIVQTPLGGIYLHRIHEPDLGKAPHNHPWRLMTLVLSGGYTETIWDTPSEHGVVWDRRRARFSLGTISLDQAHRITSVEGKLWTLALVGRRRGSWGFWTSDGFVPWQEYYTRTSNGYADEDGALWGNP